jgi:hypothetical protein
MPAKGRRSGLAMNLDERGDLLAALLIILVLVVSLVCS